MAKMSEKSAAQVHNGIKTFRSWSILAWVSGREIFVWSVGCEAADKKFGAGSSNDMKNQPKDVARRRIRSHESPRLS